MNEFLHNEQLDAAVSKIIREHGIAVNNLTEKQLAEAFKQAVLAGDFQRNVVIPEKPSEMAQFVYYMPYAEVQKLRSKIEHLESTLNAFKNAWDGIMSL